MSSMNNLKYDLQDYNYDLKYKIDEKSVINKYILRDMWKLIPIQLKISKVKSNIWTRK